MADILTFPTARFAPSDLAELARWTTSASANAMEGYQAEIERTESGEGYACISRGGADGALAFTVAPCRGGWRLEDHRGAVVGTFGTLRCRATINLRIPRQSG